MKNREKIKQIIRESGHTYESLGREIGVSAQAISEIVSGRTKGRTARYALAVALGMTVEELWPGSIAPSDLTGAVDLVPSAQSNGRAEDAPPPTAPPRPRDLRSVQRIAAVHATGLLGAPADARLERLVRIAHRSSNASVAVLTIIDGQRQHIVASAGLTRELRRTYPVDVGVCPYVVAEGDVLVINNLSREARFPSDRLLKDCDAMSCLAVPVRDPAGHRLGALSVIDSRPRRWSEKHTQVLKDLALPTAEVIRARRQSDSLARTRRKLEEVRGLFTRLIDQVLGLAE